MGEEMQEKLRKAIQRLEEEGLIKTAASLRLAAICIQSRNTTSTIRKPKRDSQPDWR